MMNEAVFALSEGLATVDDIDSGMKEMVDAGYLGRKSGRGFYDYSK